MLLSSLPLVLAVLWPPLVQYLDNTMRCAPPYGICHTSQYACGNVSHSMNYYDHSHCRYNGTSGTAECALISASRSLSATLRSWLPPLNCFPAVTTLHGLWSCWQFPPDCRPGCRSCWRQLGEKPPIIFCWYTLYQVVAMLTLWYCTGQTVHTEVKVVPIPLDLRCLFLHILAISPLYSWHFVLQSSNI